MNEDITIEDRLRRLAAAREQLILVSEQTEALRSAAMAALYAAHREFDAEMLLKAEIASLEAELRHWAVQRFEVEPRNKQPAPGLGIRVQDVYEYDVLEALGWAQEHGLCLALDEPAFRAVCRTPNNRPAFVSVRSVVMATIARDLRRYYACSAEEGETFP